MMLSEIVSPESYVARSVNLERDMGDEGTLSQYFLTGKGLEIINRLVDSLNGSKISAWSLTGPYGMGKSSFANYLLSLCGPKRQNHTKLAKKMLTEKDPELVEKFDQVIVEHRSITKGFFRVRATSSFQSVNHTLARGLLRSLRVDGSNGKLFKNPNKLASKVKKLLEYDHIDTQTLMDLFKEIRHKIRSPVIIVIDEFGKNLEFMARYPDRGDLYILQTLAETDNIFLWVCLHQAFEEYATGFSTRQLQEWGKIQGRFEDVSFVEPKMQMIEFIGKALIRKTIPSSIEEKIENWADSFSHKAKQLNLSEFDAINTKAFSSFYPLHPLAAIILPELCVRFAQNDRTLFAFLCGGEPNALPSFLTSQSIIPETGTLETLGLNYLYDYFISSFQTISANRPESNRWIEINNIIENTAKLPEEEHRLLKIIGLLNLISGLLGFRASEKLLSYAVFQPFSENKKFEFVKNVVRNLNQKGILIYREYADEYRLWEGTDFDIVSAMKEQRERLSAQPLVEILEKTLPLMPLTASRHSYETGTLRHFEGRWFDVVKLLNEAPEFLLAGEAYGFILYCFGNEIIQKEFIGKTKDNRPVVVAYARCEDQIRDVILDAAAAKAILTEYPELERDGVARKEARHRAQVAGERLKGYLSDLFNPGHPDVKWFANNKEELLRSHRDLSSLLSRLCNEFYKNCPIIQNELINRNKLTSAAAKARRELIEAMLVKEAHENLGMQGTGPEVAIYRTMLKAEGLHRKEENGIWKFEQPNPNSHFSEAWSALVKLTNEADGRSLPVQSLIDMLKRPPFGMKEGPIPVLLCLFLIIHSDEIAVYQEDAFLPFLGPEEMELMTKRPEYFKIRSFAPVGSLEMIFQIYKNLLSPQLTSHEKVLRNITIVNVIGPLVQFVNNLPFYVQRTKTLSKHAQNLRHVILNAREPMDLLFVDIPQAVGIPPFDQTGPVSDKTTHDFQTRFRSALLDLSHAYTGFLKRAKGVFLSIFSVEDDLDILREDLKEAAVILLNRCTDKDLRPFISCLTRPYSSEEEWMIAVATIISGRPFDSWRDMDEDAFPSKLSDFVRRFKDVEAIAAAEEALPQMKRDHEARLVSLTRPDGKSYSEVFWFNRKQRKKLGKSLSNLEKELSPEELKCLFALIGDSIMNKEKPFGEE